jgi:hypothetical protein
VSPRPSTQSVTPTFTTVPAPGRSNAAITAWPSPSSARCSGRCRRTGHRALFEIAGLVRVPARLFVPRPQVRRRGREDLEAVGCAVHAGGDREAVGPALERAPVALVGDDHVRAAELPSRFQLGSVEDPVIRSMHGVGARSVGRSESVLRVPAAGEGEADRRGLGPADAPIGPAAREELLIRRAEDRVLVRQVLVAGHPTMVRVEPDLPEARVPRQDGGVATAPDERVERVAHAPGPVLVVADAEVQSGPLEDLGVSLGSCEIATSMRCPVASAQRMKVRSYVNHRPRRTSPTGRAGGPRCGTPSPPGRALLHHPADRLWLDQEAPGERALERHARPPRVQRRSRPSRCTRARSSSRAPAGSARGRRDQVERPGTRRRVGLPRSP